MRFYNVTPPAIGGGVDARMNSRSLIIAAPVEKRFSILEQVAWVSGMHHFETEEPRTKS